MGSPSQCLAPSGAYSSHQFALTSSYDHSDTCKFSLSGLVSTNCRQELCLPLTENMAMAEAGDQDAAREWGSCRRQKCWLSHSLMERGDPGRGVGRDK